MSTRNKVITTLWLLSTISALTRNIGIHAAPTECKYMESSIISRSAWGAHPPKDRFTFDGPAPFVIIHHSYKPDVALSPSCCRKSMLEIQNLHQKERGWSDIGYTFAICGDGNVYEGRGFNVVAAHAPLYNNRSIGLLLIGDFTDKLPPQSMMDMAKDFIRYSVECGYLRKDYILYGHRQVRNGTDCPGDAFYAEIKKWPHWQEDVKDIA